MDKLTKYNQKLLAIIGTAVVAVAGVLLIVGIVGGIISLFDSSGSGDHGLRAGTPDMVPGDSTQYIRTQEVTFSHPCQLDTAQSKYLIAVGQVNLRTSEKIERGSKDMLELADSFEYGFSSSNYKHSSSYGLYNNFIYCNYASGLTQQIFNEKVAVTHWIYLMHAGIEVLLFKGTITDDNSDGQMNSDDYQALFAYYLSDGQLKKHLFTHKTVIDLKPMAKTDLVSINLGVDKNKDFNFDRQREPEEIFILNIRTREVQPAVSAKMKQEIQGLIDGRN